MTTTVLHEQEPDGEDVAGRISALEDERRRLLDRLATIRAELAGLRAPQTWQIAPPEQWSRVQVGVEDVEEVLRRDPAAEWTVTALHQHLPNASEGQLRRQLGRLVKRGLVLTPARGRYVLARLTPQQYRDARAPQVPLRQRLLDTFLAAEQRAWTRAELLDHLDPPATAEYAGQVLTALVNEHYLTLDPKGWYRVLPATVRQALHGRDDTEIVGTVATRSTAARTRAPRRTARTRGR